MRSYVLVASMSLLLIVSDRVVAQTTQGHSADHDHPVPGPLGARTLTVRPFTTLPKGILFLRLENFPTTKAGRQAATPASAVVEWADKVWLITLGAKGGRFRAGTFVAEIGPVPEVPPAASYVLDVNEADLGPDTRAEAERLQIPNHGIHTHPGPEIFYLLTGEQCLETPNAIARARAGEGMVAPANTPMELNITGSTKRDAFFVIVHDSTKPRVTSSDWQSTGRCYK